MHVFSNFILKFLSLFLIFDVIYLLSASWWNEAFLVAVTLLVIQFIRLQINKTDSITEFIIITKETIVQYLNDKRTWILIASILVISCAIYVPWHLPESIRIKYIGLKYIKDYPSITYNWIWETPIIYHKKAYLVIDYYRIFLNILVSLCSCIIGYLLVTFIYKPHRHK